MKTTVLTTVYKGVEAFFKDFLDSLNNQTDKSFTLVIINDGMKNAAGFLANCKFGTILIDIVAGQTVAEIREHGIRYCIDNFDYIIFADSDDFFHPSRIEYSMQALQDNDIVLHDLAVADSGGRKIYPALFKELRGKPICFNDLIDRNYFGLSNTAVKTRILPAVLPIPGSITAVDWWIFSILIYLGFKAAFLPDSLTYYRQHYANAVGANPELNKEYLIKAVQIKQNHYYFFSLYFDKINDLINAGIFKDKYERMKYIKEKILPEDRKLDQYIREIKGLEQKSSAWWANIVDFVPMEDQND